jgi:hypothetical protein
MGMGGWGRTIEGSKSPTRTYLECRTRGAGPNLLTMTLNGSIRDGSRGFVRGGAAACWRANQPRGASMAASATVEPVRALRARWRFLRAYRPFPVSFPFRYSIYLYRLRKERAALESARDATLPRFEGFMRF